jgi:hypothetical protein
VFVRYSEAKKAIERAIGMCVCVCVWVGG